MRGKHDAKHGDFYERGITPADAGKTTSRPCSGAGCQDHPRGCGENISAARRIANLQGSPPRMRGKLDTPAEETETDRITPADAGKTVFRRGSRLTV